MPAHKTADDLKFKVPDDEAKLVVASTPKDLAAQEWLPMVTVPKNKRIFLMYREKDAEKFILCYWRKTRAIGKPPEGGGPLRWVEVEFWATVGSGEFEIKFEPLGWKPFDQ
jgi:hypothetical protein